MIVKVAKQQLYYNLDTFLLPKSALMLLFFLFYLEFLFQTTGTYLYSNTAKQIYVKC